MTRKEIRTLIRTRIGEPIARYFQNLEIDTWINDAGNDIAFRTKCLRSTDLMTTTSAAEYTISTDIDDDILSIYDVYLYRDGSKWWKLDATTQDELDIIQNGWKSFDASTPTKYWYDVQLDALGLYPKPNSSNQGAGYVKVYVNQKFTHLTADSGTPVLPVPLHLAMVDYGTAIGLDARADKNAEIVKSNNAWMQYYKKIQQYLSESRREKTDEQLIMKSYRNIG